MKKTIILLLALSALLFAGCKKPEYPGFLNPDSPEFTHGNVEISSMLMISYGMPTSSSLEGVIDQEAGTVLFIVPRADRSKFDLTQVKLQATVYLDSVISPKLSDRLWDVTSDDEGNPKVRITVTSQITGESKEYTVKGYVSSK